MRKIMILSFVIFMASVSVFADGNAVINTPNTPPPINTPTKPTVPPKDIPKGLIILNDFYAVDENFVYAINSTNTAWVKIPTADRTNFTVIRGQFARDVDQIFFRGKKIEGIDVRSFSMISAQHGYARDSKRVYGPEGLIEDADVDTFKLLAGGVYALDTGHVYVRGRAIDADAGSFRVLKEGLYAVDDSQVFHDGNLLKGISPD
jgi:hypothetical protein